MVVCLSGFVWPQKGCKEPIAKDLARGKFVRREKGAERKVPEDRSFFLNFAQRNAPNFPQFFVEFSWCFVSWEKETTKNSLEIPADCHCKIPRQIDSLIFSGELARQAVFWRRRMLFRGSQEEAYHAASWIDMHKSQDGVRTPWEHLLLQEWWEDLRDCSIQKNFKRSLNLEADLGEFCVSDFGCWCKDLWP